MPISIVMLRRSPSRLTSSQSTPQLLSADSINGHFLKQLPSDAFGFMTHTTFTVNSSLESRSWNLIELFYHLFFHESSLLFSTFILTNV
jgi:hypothetical protein